MSHSDARSVIKAGSFVHIMLNRCAVLCFFSVYIWQMMTVNPTSKWLFVL